ncbi:hypothetical protein KM043_003542 [Ampulex compressa]|nr:hypothetical protein KM043_003542 [Ampulex compressa]
MEEEEEEEEEAAVIEGSIFGATGPVAIRDSGDTGERKKKPAHTRDKVPRELLTPQPPPFWQQSAASGTPRFEAQSFLPPLLRAVSLAQCQGSGSGLERDETLLAPLDLDTHNQVGHYLPKTRRDVRAKEGWRLEAEGEARNRGKSVEG